MKGEWATVKIVHAVYALITDPSRTKILMVQNNNSRWTLPGGKAEHQETLAAAAIREVKEETGLDIELE